MKATVKKTRASVFTLSALILLLIAFAAATHHLWVVSAASFLGCGIVVFRAVKLGVQEPDYVDYVLMWVFGFLLFFGLFLLRYALRHSLSN